MKRIYISFFLLVVFQLLNLPIAHSQNQTIIGIGVGMMSCGKYVDYYNKRNEQQLTLFVTWIWGYMVAYQNRGYFASKSFTPKEGQLSNVPDEETVKLYVKTYCEKKPTDIVSSAADSLIVEYGGTISYKSRLQP